MCLSACREGSNSGAKDTAQARQPPHSGRRQVLGLRPCPQQLRLPPCQQGELAPSQTTVGGAGQVTPARENPRMSWCLA